MNRTLFYFLLIAALSASAQSINPLTINVGGSLSKIVDYSIGESASISYFQSTNPISLSTGFIQSYTTLVTGIIQQVFEEGELLTLAPNPANEYIRLKGAIKKPGFIEFQLLDLQGRIVEIYPSTYYINYLEKEINVAHLLLGSYLIRLIYFSSDGINQSASFKFIKIN
jgi:hypothetical protein